VNPTNRSHLFPDAGFSGERQLPGKRNAPRSGISIMSWATSTVQARRMMG